MGIGDDIMATGMARGAAKRGKRIAFGDCKKIRWGPHSGIAFENNPNIAPPGSEGANDLEWIEYYKGKRNYNSVGDGRWIWNYDFKAIPGEFFFTLAELERGKRLGTGFVVIEPNVPQQKSVARNKQWPVDRYQEVSSYLINKMRRRVVQLHYPGATYSLSDVSHMKTDSFRDACALLANSALYIGAEGGMHHAAAALGIPAVVLFGGFIPPSVTGYDTHINLTGGASACGSLRTCDHCRQAMDDITVKHVCDSTHIFLDIRRIV